MKPSALLFILSGMGTVLAAGNLSAAEDATLVRFETIQANDRYYSEGAGFGDLNGDGADDAVSGPFWYEGPDFTEGHAYYPPKPGGFGPNAYTDNFFSFVHDFNADGRLDILMLPFPGEPAFWFENPGADGLFGHWPKHLAVSQVGNESPAWADLTGDGRKEVVCIQDGYYGFAEPDPEDPRKPWKFRRLSDQTAGGKFTHGMGLGDIDGDGRLDLLDRRGWWKQPESLDGDPQWTFHPFLFTAPGGSQIFAYDLDGDGDNDVVTSIVAHGWGLSWFEQIPGPDGGVTFREHSIMNKEPTENAYGIAFSQLHALNLVDMDGDGLRDIVTGKTYWAHHGRDPGGRDPAVLYWFKTVRSGRPGEVDFVPHRIHDDSGIGRQLTVGDVDGDGFPDIVIGNAKGTFVHLQKRRQVTRAEYEAAQPQPLKTMAAGLEPEEAAANMTVPSGFQVELIAGEPDVHQPIAFTFDHRGRIWIAEAFTYPARAAEGGGRDRILILADEDGNGSFETRKVFAEGLNLVSGLEVGFGGVWVGAAPYLLFIPDRDGDDQPDGDPEVLLDGFGYQDTHETLNSFIWGPDGWLYGCHGVFTHSRVGKPGTPDHERTPLNAGVWRYHPVRHEFEVFAWGTSNPWGVDFNDHGQAFMTACVIPHLYHVIQGARYQRQAGQHFNPHVFDDIKTIADHAHYAGNIQDHAWWGSEPELPGTTSAAGGGHAHCGAMVYLGDNWPESYRNRIFMHNIHGNRINQDSAERNGSGFVGRHRPDFLFARDQWFRGISLKYGPDGAVYLIDWYDPNACHRTNPEIWDRTNGRVYRVAYGEVKSARLNLGEWSDSALAALQTHPNEWHVRVSRRLLQERAADPDRGVSGESRRLLTQTLNENEGNPRGLRALWALHATGGIGRDRARRLLNSENEYVRAWTIQLSLERDGDGSDSDIAGLLPAIAREDSSPVVRLYAASALQRLPGAARWAIAEELVLHAEDAGDPNLPLMIWYGIEPLVSQNPQRALALAGRARIPQIARHIVRRAAIGGDNLEALVGFLGADSNADLRLMILDEMLAAFKGRADLAMPRAWTDTYDKLTDAAVNDPAIGERADRIAAAFGDRRLFPKMRRLLADTAASLDERRRAMTILIEGRDPGAATALIAALGEPDLRASALRALAAHDRPNIPGEILARYGNLAAPERLDAVAALISRPEWALTLLKAVDRGAVPSRDLHAYHIRQLQRFDNPEIDRIIEEAWGAARKTSEDKRAQIHEYMALLNPERLKEADLSNGRRLFNELCASCHRLFGEGGQIGPDLTGSNRANLEYLLENVVDPNAVVGHDYLMTELETTDGRVLTGLVVAESDSAVTLRTITDEIVVPKSVLDFREVSPLSLMPEGLFAALNKDEIRDVTAYLASPVQARLRGPAAPIDPKTGRVPGALEGETLEIKSLSTGRAISQKMGGFAADRWSAADQLWWTGGKPGDRLTLKLPAPEPGRYAIEAVMTRASDYAIVRLYLNGTEIQSGLDLFNAPEVVTTGVLRLGTHQLEKENRFTVEILGANPKAVKAHMVGLDYIRLVPQ